MVGLEVADFSGHVLLLALDFLALLGIAGAAGFECGQLGVHCRFLLLEFLGLGEVVDQFRSLRHARHEVGSSRMAFGS